MKSYHLTVIVMGIALALEDERRQWESVGLGFEVAHA